jgi:threonyl-tRNA synthetase
MSYVVRMRHTKLQLRFFNRLLFLLFYKARVHSNRVLGLCVYEFSILEGGNGLLVFGYKLG